MKKKLGGKHDSITKMYIQVTSFSSIQVLNEMLDIVLNSVPTDKGLNSLEIDWYPSSVDFEMSSHTFDRLIE